MTQYLMVPIRVDALYVQGNEQPVVAQNADFSILPYLEKVAKKEINSETPNISEAIVNQPFQAENLRLDHGIHLHWALPDALTRGDHNLSFPVVPDRWLVTRRRKSDGKIEKQWVVESNYLYPPGINKRGSSVSIPYSSARWVKNEQTDQYEYRPNADEDVSLNDQRADQPFRFMGRSMPADAWQSDFQNVEYYPNLTAIGYGEPTFAAFYPNCFGVFGFHDKNPGSDLSQISYEVSGWYGNPEQDVLQGLTTAEIKEAFDWELANETGSPKQTLCYGSVSFGADALPENPDKTSEVNITVAETLTEALSACLAEKLTESGNKDQLKSIEDQLEAMQLAFQLDETKLDTVARFKELRHRNGFTDVDSGSIWTLGKESDQLNEQSDQQQVLDILPPEIAFKIAEVNELQRQYDREQHRIDSLRKQLFADWYKYMICLYPPDNQARDYPDVDLVKYFIETKLLRPLEYSILRNGELGEISQSDDRITSIGLAEGSSASSRASQLVTKINNLIASINNATVEFNEKYETQAIFYLKQTPGPRYKRSNDPVVLIEGDAVKPSQRHGADGTLTCHLLELSSMDSDAFKKITDKIDELRTAAEAENTDNFAFHIQSEQPWNPFLMDWEAEVLPLAQKQTSTPLPPDHFAEDMITAHYAAPVLEPDLTLKINKGKIRRAAKVYSGQNILTSEANQLLEDAIKKRLIDDLNIFENASDISSANLDAETVSKGFKSPTYTLVSAYEKLNPKEPSEKLNSLSQSLNGFNESLLMHKQTMELEVEDPIGFERYQQFSDGYVRDAMGDNIRIAPSPLNDFSPIRSGCLKLSRIRLVDTFGQTLSLSTDKVDTSYKLTEASSKHLVRLTPRLMQPARLNFRWLMAADDTGKSEMQNHPSTTPICGWLQTNKIDKSLGVYDSDGHALGYFKANDWHQAIDSDRAKELEDIENPYLKRVAEFITASMSTDSEFLNQFIATIDDALGNIQPESVGNIQSPTLLIGRPIGVTRASFNLELQGNPAVNQDWNIFRQDIARNTRSTNNFTKVKFPIRLGEYGQFNDGLVGYWVEQMADDGAIRFAPDVGDGNVKFYSPQSDQYDSPAIESRFESGTDGPINLYQSIDDDPIRTTMLVDVRGSVHATLGILPSKKISIPRDIYEEALQNIEVSFLYAPLLTQLGRIQISLHPVADYEWSWVECASTDAEGDKTWNEFFPENRIEQATFTAEWETLTGQATGLALWYYLLQEDVNWLATVDDDEDGNPDTGRAKIINKDERALTTLDDKRFASAEGVIQQIFDLRSIGIDPVVNNMTAISPYEIREGWLKLRRKQPYTSPAS